MNCCLFNILANLHNFTNFVDAGAISKEEKYIQRWPGYTFRHKRCSCQRRKPQKYYLLIRNLYYFSLNPFIFASVENYHKVIML